MTKSNIGKLYIRKRMFPEWLTYIIFVLPFAFALLLDLFNLPDFIKYIIDVAWIGLLVILLLRRNTSVSKKLTPFVAIVGIFFIYTFIVYVLNFQSPFYYLWGIRNNFRFYIAFFAYSLFLSEDDANSCLKFMDVLFWINVGVSLVQFFALGYRQDRLGGIFGVEVGCNAYSINFFTIVLTKSLLLFMNKEESATLCLSKCVAALIIAALAELKAFYFFFILILIMASMFTSFSWQKLLLLIIGALLVMLSASLLGALFEEFEGFLSFEKLWEAATQEHYSSSESLNRLAAIPTIARTLLTDFSDRLFGLGLGNCDTSAFAICNTPFYQRYSYLRYNWFSSAFLFLETGYIGLILYFTFFILCFVLARKQMKSGNGNRLFCQMAMIMSVLCIILMFYNASLRMEAAYMIYFVLALPFIDCKKTNKD